MRFYTKQHKFFCGIDLHAKSMYLCILNSEGEIVLHRNIKTDSHVFLKTIAPYRERAIRDTSHLLSFLSCLPLWRVITFFHASFPSRLQIPHY